MKRHEMKRGPSTIESSEVASTAVGGPHQAAVQRQLLQRHFRATIENGDVAETLMPLLNVELGHLLELSWEEKDLRDAAGDADLSPTEIDEWQAERLDHILRLSKEARCLAELIMRLKSRGNRPENAFRRQDTKAAQLPQTPSSVPQPEGTPRQDEASLN